MSFQFFNPAKPVEISRGSLPHWDQAGATYFITFRTKDSIPAEVMDCWMADRNSWLEGHNVSPSDPDLSWQIECLPDEARREYHRLFTTRWHDSLDACHGSCVLKNRALSDLVAKTLLHFDGERYEMADFVVMPNHVHLIAGIQGRGEMKRLCRSWKKFSATEINKRTGREGEFWQPESFDHIVRNQSSFDRFRKYIAENPVKAHLSSGEFFLYQRPASQSSPVTP